MARRRKQEARFAALPDKLVAVDLDLESGRCRLALHRRLRIEATRQPRHCFSVSSCEWLDVCLRGSDAPCDPGIGSGAPHEEGRFQGGDLR
jgi:hypothetical protein